MPPKKSNSMSKKSEVKEITKIANSSVESYFSTAARRKAAQSDPNAELREGGRGTSRKKTLITSKDAVQWNAQNNNNNNKNVKQEQKQEVIDDDEAVPQSILEEDDDEWETVVVNPTNVKKEEANNNQAAIKKEETLLRQDAAANDDSNATQNQQQVLNTDDFGVARALQKERQQAARQRVIASCCSLIVFRIAQGKWMRDRVAANGMFSLALRKHPHFAKCFKQLDEIFSKSISGHNIKSSNHQERNLQTSIAKNVDRLRPTWLSLKKPTSSPGSATTKAKTNAEATTTGTDAAPKEKEADNSNKNKATTDPSAINNALAVIAECMHSYFKLELPTPSLHGRHDDEDGRQQSSEEDDDDEDDNDDDEMNNNNNMMMMMPMRRTAQKKNKKKKEPAELEKLRKSAKRFCDLNDILHVPPPLLLAPFVQSAVKAGKNQFNFDEAENGDDDQNNNTNGQQQQQNSHQQKSKMQSFFETTSNDRVLHSCWWTLLFAAICNASRHLSDFRICISFDLFVCHQLEKARFGHYNSFGKWSSTAPGAKKEEDATEGKVKKEEALSAKVKKEEAGVGEDGANQQNQEQSKKDEDEEEKKHFKPQQTIWVELWNPERDCYVPVSTPMIFSPPKNNNESASQDAATKTTTTTGKKQSATTTKTATAAASKTEKKKQDEQEKFLADLVGGPRWNSAYVLAFGRDGTVIDVSAKYANSWSKIFPMRLDYMMRNHHQGELDATREISQKHVFSCATNDDSTPNNNTMTMMMMSNKDANTSLLPTPEDITSAINANTRTLAPLIRNCEHLLPPNASWSDHLLSRLNRGKVRSLDLAYKLTRDRLQLHLLKYGGDPVPKTLMGIKQHPLYICDTQIARHETIYPRDASTTVGLFRGAPVYRRTAVRPLRGIEGWLRLKRMIKTDTEPAKTCPPPASRPLARHSRLFGIWQTEAYQPLPLREEINVDDDDETSDSDDDDDDDDANNRNRGVKYVIPTLNSYLDWYIILKGYKLPRGLSHFKQIGIRGVARRMNIEFTTAVVGFKKQEDPVTDENDNNNMNNNNRFRSTRAQDPNRGTTAEQFKRAKLQAQQRKPWKAVFDGIIVKTQDAERLKTAYDEFIRVKEMKEKAKRRARAFQWWNILVTRRLAMERLANAL